MFCFLILGSSLDVPVLLAKSVPLTEPVFTDPLVTAYFSIEFTINAVSSLMAFVLVIGVLYTSFVSLNTTLVNE